MGLNLRTEVAKALIRLHLILRVLSTFGAKFDWDTLAHHCGMSWTAMDIRGNNYSLHSSEASASFKDL
jgi:hypothetical protein